MSEFKLDVTKPVVLEGYAIPYKYEPEWAVFIAPVDDVVRLINVRTGRLVFCMNVLLTQDTELYAENLPEPKIRPWTAPEAAAHMGAMVTNPQEVYVFTIDSVHSGFARLSFSRTENKSFVCDVRFSELVEYRLKSDGSPCGVVE